MIVNPDVLFLHIPKTGGTSCTDYLCQALTGPVFLSSLHYQTSATHFQASVIPGISHETLSEIHDSRDELERKTGIRLDEIKLIVAVLRHPYEIELSNYHFYRDGNRNILSHRMFRDARTVWRIDLAQGDFAGFVAQSGHFRVGFDGVDLRCEDYFLVGGQMDPRIRLLRAESLSVDFPRLLQPYTRSGVDFPFVNRSRRESPVPFEDLDDDLRELIYLKHRWVFDNGYYGVPS
jgi:Sulfotransferase family